TSACASICCWPVRRCCNAPRQPASIANRAPGSGRPITPRPCWSLPMSESDWPASLSDSELEELDQFLRAHPGEDHLLLDGVHGLLTSLAIGPSPATPDEWLPEVLHEPFADIDEGERILTLLARLNDSVTLEIETGAYEPILGEIDTDDGGSAFTARGWCEGLAAE